MAMDKKEIMAKEDPKFIIGRFVMSIQHDVLNKDPHSASIYPEWSEETILWWNEIESRMTAPACLNFDWENAKEILKNEIDQETDHMKHCDKSQVSWRDGIIYGLNRAWAIMDVCVRMVSHD